MRHDHSNHEWLNVIRFENSKCRKMIWRDDRGKNRRNTNKGEKNGEGTKMVRGKREAAQKAPLFDSEDCNDDKNKTLEQRCWNWSDRESNEVRWRECTKENKRVVERSPCVERKCAQNSDEEYDKHHNDEG